MIKTHSVYYPLYADTSKPIILITGGRGSGKSYAVSTFLERLSFEFQMATNKYGQLKLSITGNQPLFNASQDASIGDWQLYMMFIYKKLA